MVILSFGIYIIRTVLTIKFLRNRINDFATYGNIKVCSARSSTGKNFLVGVNDVWTKLPQKLNMDLKFYAFDVASMLSNFLSVL